MKKLCSLIAGGTLLLANAAFAAQPLSDTQMDRVTAGQNVAVPGVPLAIANAGALALGEVSAETTTRSATDVNTATFPRYAIGLANSVSLAEGGIFFQVQAAAHADSAAALP